MSDETNDGGLRARLSRQGEETLGRLAQDLLENPFVSGALQRGFEAREKASQAQVAAMGALNLPSAADLERLTRRVRSVGQRERRRRGAAGRPGAAARVTGRRDRRDRLIDRGAERRARQGSGDIRCHIGAEDRDSQAGGREAEGGLARRAQAHGLIRPSRSRRRALSSRRPPATRRTPLGRDVARPLRALRLRCARRTRAHRR